MKPWPYNNNRNSVPYARGSDTSREAAQSMVAHAPTLRVKVYQYLCSLGNAGSTDDAMEVALGLSHSTASPRRRRLVELGAVYKTDERRPTRAGRSATVWVAIPGIDVTAKHGRPPKPPANALSRRLTVYMTDGQYLKVKQIADESGKTLGTAARELMGVGYNACLRGIWPKPDNA